MQFVDSSNNYHIEADPAKLLPQLLHQLIVIGKAAEQLSHALGRNGHRPELVRELIEQLGSERG